MLRKKLTKNAAKCLRCGDIVESHHRHDFKWCSCRNLAVDGGLAYERRVFSDAKLVEDLCEYTEYDDGRPIDDVGEF